VSGTIFLTSELKIKNGNVTIAGQTAPGDGICIANYPFVIACKNIIIRYVRFRLGNMEVAHHEGDGLGGMDSENIIIDHCSVSWSIDECLSVYGSKNITVQWCIVSQSLNNAGHSKGAHGYGGNWGGSGASYHHNLMAHHISRTPRLGPRPGTQTDERMDMRNNVIYNWIDNGVYGGEGMNVNIVNNYYKPGPDTKTGAKGMRIASPGIRTSDYTKHDSGSPNQWDKMWHVWGKYYVVGNVNTKYPQVTDDNWTYGIYNQIDNSKVDNTFTQETKDTMRIDTPIWYEQVTTHSAEQAFEQVLTYAGASLHRDAVDEVMVSDARNGETTYTGSGCKKGIINSQEDLRPADADDGWSAWPELKSEEAPADTDGDGIPDEWEQANGLEPNDPADGAETAEEGYTNLEVYLASLVADITLHQNDNGKSMSGQETTAVTVPFRDNRPSYDNHVYTLSGRQASTPLQKGIYIKNQRKVIVR
ncbi:MAG: pectate lyase, partial [Prevotella sp.]|nr:pectate lyase [Prevotella sp.]